MIADETWKAREEEGVSSGSEKEEALGELEDTQDNTILHEEVDKEGKSSDKGEEVDVESSVKEASNGEEQEDLPLDKDIEELEALERKKKGNLFFIYFYF